MKSIESASNPTFRTLKSLLESKGIKKEKHFFVFGEKPIDESLKASHPSTRYIVATQELSQEAHRLHRYLSGGADTLFLSQALFKELDIFGIDYPILVNAAPVWKAWDQKGPALICPFQNPLNLGGALRSALAFGFKVVLTKESAHPLHPRSIRAVSGNILQHHIELGPSVREIEVNGITVIDQGGENISDYKFKKDAILLVGEEGQGVPEQLSQAPKVSIPIAAKLESLNATVALSIAAFQYRTQFPM